jgi:hypothetical protein
MPPSGHHMHIIHPHASTYLVAIKCLTYLHNNQYIPCVLSMIIIHLDSLLGIASSPSSMKREVGGYQIQTLVN